MFFSLHNSKLLNVKHIQYRREAGLTEHHFSLDLRSHNYKYDIYTHSRLDLLHSTPSRQNAGCLNHLMIPSVKLNVPKTAKYFSKSFEGNKRYGFVVIITHGLNKIEFITTKFREYWEALKRPVFCRT